MIGWVLRRFRWVLIGAGVKFFARQGVSRSVDDATAAIEQRLPAPIVTVAKAMPGDLLRAGGTAAVSAKAARRTGALAARGGVAAARGSRAVARFAPDQRQRLSDSINRAKSLVRDETEAVRREMMSDYARHVDGESAALEALLDLRDVEAEPIPDVPPAVAPGRRRFRRPLPAPEVARAQRTYRRPRNSWDRPGSRR